MRRRTRSAWLVLAVTLAVSGCGGSSPRTASPASPSPSARSSAPTATPTGNTTETPTGSTLGKTQADALLKRAELTPASLSGYAPDGKDDDSTDTTAFDFCREEYWAGDSGLVAQVDHHLDTSQQVSVDETLGYYRPHQAELSLASMSAAVQGCGASYADRQDKTLVSIVARNDVPVPGAAASVLESASPEGHVVYRQSVVFVQSQVLVVESVSATSRATATAVAQRVVRTAQQRLTAATRPA